MKMKIITGMIFVLILSIGISTTYFLVRQEFSRKYQVNQWVQQNKLHVETFVARAEVNSRSMFNNAFNVEISIGGYLQDYGKGYELKIQDVHISERVEEVNNQVVAYIKITPIVSSNLKKPANDFKQNFSYNFTHKLHTFLPSNINKYVLQCGEQEQVIEIEQHK